MASKLRVRFRERQCKHLSESIAVNPTPSKKACPKPVSVPPLVSVPPTTVAAITLESDEKLPSANDIAYHEIRRPFFVPDNISEELFEYMNSSPSRSKSAYVPSLEEVIVGVQNLMWQHIHLFYRLEIVETMKAYIAHNMDKNEDLLASLEMTKSEATAA
uniref:Uncharacterized protein n=1 Tax=Vitis vinifera TaxID=29760 RepID=A5BJ72_VITVI|nr:hypothetical protein VITISV_033808 [Vitis vinifera]